MKHREIKFRAWDRKEKKMYYLPPFVALIDTIDGRQIKAQMQFTGLHDKNGKEIYEGDIVRSGGTNYKVKMEFGMWMPFDTTGEYGPEPENTTIIGNIYENSELLN